MEKLKCGKSFELIIVFILAIIIALSLYGTFGKKEEQTSKNNYCDLEEKLASVLSNIDGVGDIQVMISFSDDGEKVIAYETIENVDGSVTKTPVIVKGDVVILEEKVPEISGVIIVATGADSISIRFNLIDATASVLNINKSIIKVYES